MDLALNTTMIYYLGLYLMVFVVRYFKQSRGTVQTKQDWNEFFSYSSLEIIYTASGFLVILLSREIRLLPIFLISYTLLLFTSSNIDRVEKLQDKTKMITHIIIIAIVVFVTVLSFSTKLRDEGDIITIYSTNERCNSAKPLRFYTVVLFYDDNSLISHVGLNNWNNKYLSFRVKVQGTTPDEAIKEATRLFWENQVSIPFRIRSWETREALIRINDTATLVQALP